MWLWLENLLLNWGLHSLSASQKTTPYLLCRIPVRFYNACLLPQTALGGGLGPCSGDRYQKGRCCNYLLCLFLCFWFTFEQSFGSLTLAPCSYLASYGNKADVITLCLDRVLARSSHTGQRRRYLQKSLGPITFIKIGRRGRLCFILMEDTHIFL